MAIKLSTGIRNTILATSSLKDAVDGKVIRLYEGAVPETADASIESATMLCEVSVNGDGTGISMASSASAGVLKKNSNESWFGSVDTSGTATFFRIVDDSDDGSLSTSQERIQGTVADAGADAYLANPSLVQGNSQSIDYFAIALPTA